jgi:hypothetical protein
LNWKTQSTKITAELKALEAKNAIEIEKSKKEVEVIEEQKKSLIQDRHKKLQIDWKELLDLGVPLEEASGGGKFASSIRKVIINLSLSILFPLNSIV